MVKYTMSKLLRYIGNGLGIKMYLPGGGKIDLTPMKPQVLPDQYDNADVIKAIRQTREVSIEENPMVEVTDHDPELLKANGGQPYDSVPPTDPEVPPTDPEVPPTDPEVPPTDLAGSDHTDGKAESLTDGIGETISDDKIPDPATITQAITASLDAQIDEGSLITSVDPDKVVVTTSTELVKDLTPTPEVTPVPEGVSANELTEYLDINYDDSTIVDLAKSLGVDGVRSNTPKHKVISKLIEQKSADIYTLMSNQI